LRFYARFIVVSLLLNRHDLINQLMEEMTRLVSEYITQFNPADASDWSAVLSEISTFLEVTVITFLFWAR
jgi:hypothetical protein